MGTILVEVSGNQAQRAQTGACRRPRRACRRLPPDILPLRRPPGCEAYWRSLLLERAAQMIEPRQAGGCVTASAMMKLHEDDVCAYIPMHVVSTTVGQISLEPELHCKRMRLSVSRMGGSYGSDGYWMSRMSIGDPSTAQFGAHERSQLRMPTKAKPSCVLAPASVSGR